MEHDRLGDLAGRGGERAAEGDHDGIGGEGAAIEQLGHAGGVGGGDPERAQGRGLRGWIGGRGELPGAGGALPEPGGGVGRNDQVGGRGVVAEGAARDGSAGVDPELEAGAGLGEVTIEDAEVLDVGRPDLGSAGFVANGDGGDRRLPRRRRRARRGGAPAALGDGDAGGADERPRWMSWPTARWTWPLAGAEEVASKPLGRELVLERSGHELSCALVNSSALTPPDLGDLVSRMARRRPFGRRERPFRFLLDSRLFRLLCDPGKTAALDGFRTSLARYQLAPEGGFPDLEMTPLAFLDVLGVEPPQYPGLPYLPKSMATLGAVDVGSVMMQSIRGDFEKVPELEPSSLRRRVDELREKTDPAAHELFDLCVTRFASRETFEDEILAQLSFDALVTFRFPEEHRERMARLFDSFLVDNRTRISGLSKVRVLKGVWDRSYERILKKRPQARREIQAADQEMKPRNFKEFLGWEMVHFSVFGYARKRVHPVVAFTPEPEDRLKLRCRAYKTALRAFLDEIPRAELAKELRPRIMAWTPGWLVPCRPDGTFESPISTGELPIF